MIRLIALSAYRNRGIVIPSGTVLEVTEQEAAYFHRDAPGVFAEYEPDITELPIAKGVPKRARNK